MKIKFPQNKGFTIVETLIYVSIFVLLLGVIITIVITLSNSLGKIITTSTLNNSLMNSTERITREIRDASSIDVLNSTFGVSSGVLKLNTTDSVGSPKTLEFYLLDGVINLKEDDILVGPLTSDRVTIETLKFNNITTDVSSAVKVEIHGFITNGPETKSSTFYNTVILRDSY